MAAAAAARAADDPVAIPGKRPMILHNDRPEDLETPLRYFDSWVTRSNRSPMTKSDSPTSTASKRKSDVSIGRW